MSGLRDMHMRGHLTQQADEDIVWLMSPDGGSLTPERVAERLGLSMDNLNKKIERAKREALRKAKRVSP